MCIGREGYLVASEFWGLARPGMIFEKKIENTYHLQLLYSSNGKQFLKKTQKALRNILNLKALAYFSSTLYLKMATYK